MLSIASTPGTSPVSSHPEPANAYPQEGYAYEGDETRQLVLDPGMIPVVPPKSNRLHPWDYDHAIYKKRNEIERLFRRLKGFRRIFSRFEKLDVLFLGFLSFALIVEALRVV
jgi:transposase